MSFDKYIYLGNQYHLRPGQMELLPCGLHLGIVGGVWYFVTPFLKFSKFLFSSWEQTGLARPSGWAVHSAEWVPG